MSTLAQPPHPIPLEPNPADSTSDSTLCQQSTWQWQGYQVHYVWAGPKETSQPPLLLIHGFGASTDHWRKNIEELSQQFQVWAIDLVGFGRSQKPDITYSSDLWRNQVTDFIHQVIGRPVVVVGNSLGGYVSLSVGAESPQWVAGVALLNSAGSFTELQPEPEPTGFEALKRQITRAIVRQPWVTFLIFINLRRTATVRKTLEKVYVDKTAVTDRLVEEILRPAFDKGAFTAFRSVFQAGGKGAKVDELLGQLTCPLLLIWGVGDPWIRAEERSAKFRQYYPQLTEHFLQAGHCPHDEVPQQVNPLLQDWGMSLN
jgi:pimeloyl-ACP methyl ester carboxylesterase